ncbi:MAG TPA: ferredoxin--NADP reductase [Burkholderiaceae bacterium]|nr:ferredoxin--NADP reductase [Burkholderiaceae bacterium]
MDGTASTPVKPARVPGELPAAKYTRQTITWIKRWSGHLFSFRITRDAGYRFKPGQFARLGVYRDDGAKGPRYIWRAYSIVSADYDEFLEFYSIVVPDGDFTTRLAQLREGDQVLIEKMSYGFLTLDRFERGKDLWLLSSGTGLAPFISILYDLRAWEQYERMILVHSVRHANELAYRDTVESFRTHELFGEQLAAHPEKLVYVPIVTRERIGDALHARIPALLGSGALEAHAGVKLDHERSRIMICGNPEMVDDIRHHLQNAGYRVSRRGEPGHMAVENYW